MRPLTFIPVAGGFLKIGCPVNELLSRGIASRLPGGPKTLPRSVVAVLLVCWEKPKIKALISKSSLLTGVHTEDRACSKA